MSSFFLSLRFCRSVCLEILVILAFGVALPASRSFAYSSANVPVDDPVYRDIDKLVAAGLVKDVIYGQRPWSRREVGRIIRKAIKARADGASSILRDNRNDLKTFLDNLLDGLERRFHDDLEDDHATFRLIPISSAELHGLFLDGEGRPIPSNGLGLIDAVIEPLTAYQEGRHLQDGFQVSLETEHRLSVGGIASLYARPRLQGGITHDSNGSGGIFMQQLYGNVGIPAIELEVGRDSLVWGQGEFGGVLLSNNARPLDLIKLSSPSPIYFPWIFKYAGPFRYTLFGANLGPEREFPHSWLIGSKFSLKPVSFFEIGFGQIVMMGGNGAPGPIAFQDFLGEMFGIRSAGGNLSNRQTGFDFRFFFPFLRNSQVYLEVQFEDDDRKKTFMLANLANYQTGLYFPLLLSDGSASLRLEYRHGSPYFYRHGPFVTGMALNRRILGDNLGPQGDGIYAQFSHTLSEKSQHTLFFQYERRDADHLIQLSDPVRRLEVVTPTPAEQRYQWGIGGRYRLRKPLSLLVDFAYERTQSFNFTDGDGRNGYRLGASIRYEL